MNGFRALLLSVLLLILGSSLLQAQTPDHNSVKQEGNINSEVKKLIQNFKKKNPKVVGLTMVTVDGVDASKKPQVARYFYGYANQSAKTPIDANTVFEIGSVTKTFVSAALALYAQQDAKFDINDEVQPYYDQHYPGEVKLPVYTDAEGNTFEMTFADLVSMHSGFDTERPYIPAKQRFKYTVADFFAYLSDTVLVNKPGTASAEFYSNTNYAILALILQKMMDAPDMAVLKQKVVHGLEIPLNHTGSVLDLKEYLKVKRSFAVGYDEEGDPAPLNLSDFPAMGGAGCLFSDQQDMMVWLLYNMQMLPMKESNQELMQNIQTPLPSSDPKSNWAMGWSFEGSGNDRVYQKDGGMYGFYALLTFNVEEQKGVMILSNTACKNCQQELGTAVLNKLLGK